MSGVKLAGVFVALSAGVSGCMFDPAEAPLDEAQVTDEASSDIDIAAAPTCNVVASFHGAWIPYYNGTPSTVDCIMVRGYNSSAVRQLQRTLNLCYHDHLAESSEFDGATETALRRAQRGAGTTPNGQYGRETRKVMLHESTNGGHCVHVP
jgi:hypothetical protein